MILVKKVISTIGTIIICLIILLPFASGGASLPTGVSSAEIGTLINEFVGYWKEVFGVVLGA